MANSNDVLPVYIGDDRTDEDAFKVNLSTLFFKVLVKTLCLLIVWQ
jgi:trehalose-6-phosphatase